MKKFLTLLLSCLLLLTATLTTACTQYHDPLLNGETGGTTETPGGSTGGNTGIGSPDEMMPFTVTLTVQRLTDGTPLPELDLDGVSALWKNSYSEFSAEFTNEGVASCKGPDGDYRVTLSKTPAGYTYDPNIYSADNKTRDIVIVLYPLRDFSRGDGYDTDTPYQILTSGVYRLKFERDAQELYFQLNPNINVRWECKTCGKSYGSNIKVCSVCNGALQQKSANSNFQIRSLIDVVANEITPTLTTYANFMYMYPKKHANTGASGTYAQNFDITLGVATGQDYSFSIHVAASRPDVYPIYVDVIMSVVGEYNFDPPYESVPVPDNIVPESKPNGTFHPMSQDERGRPIPLDDSNVFYNDADEYYHYGSETGPVIYAKFIGNSLLDFQDPQTRADRCGNVRLNYADFLNALIANANSDGNYPVTKEIKDYLYNLSVSKAMFWDGYGSAEGDAGYSSSERAQWLWACGYYQ